MSDNKFLLDANALINVSREYYSFKVAPAFWEWTKKQIENGNFILLKVVYDELQKGNDELKAWSATLDKDLIFNHKEDALVIAKYGEVIRHLNDCGYYKEVAIKDWAEGSVADPWLIAMASVHGGIIATNEAKKGSLQKAYPSSEAKIPNVADYFGVKCMKFIDVLETLKFKF